MGELITFFTPTYNRAHLLHRCYESLQRQSSFNFKWLVIDDGSTDGTEDVVREWMNTEKNFKIDYVYKKNEGMYSGYNKALEIMDTPLCVCFESDDIMSDKTMDIIERNWQKIKDRDDLIGFITPCVYHNGEVIGDLFPDDVKEMQFYERFLKYHLKGDKTVVHKTEALRKFAPMPVFEGEKCLNPTYLMYKADSLGKLLVSNEAFVIAEYLESGMTDTVLWQYYNSPNSFAYMRKIAMQFPGAPFSYVFKINIHYVSSCCLAKKLRLAVKESPKKAYTVFAFLPGLLLAGYVKFKNRDKKK